MGVLFLEFDNPLSFVAFRNNYFEKNTGDMGACLLPNQPSGTVLVENNVFIENFGYTEARVFIGSGSVLQTAGTPSTYIKFYNNLNIFNDVEYKG